MISPDQIKQQALKWWKPFLQSAVLNKPFFPMSIERIGKVQPDHVTQHFEALRHEIEVLYRHSKNETGKGYLIKTANRNFRRSGSHELPDHIIFETAEDYISYINKEEEWRRFKLHLAQITEAIPHLKEWALNNCLGITQPGIHWGNLLKVCRYFLETPRPYLYIRQLPIEIPTKFIEENSAIVQSLLDFLIPQHIRVPEQRRLAERYFLKYDEPLIRIRILDKNTYPLGNLTDISIPVAQFRQTNWTINNILITENKMNFLALPELSSTIAIWSGGGFNISHLQGIDWIAGKNILYWGDIDEHGFQILHQLRTYYPNTLSVLMDKETFDYFSQYVVDGPRNNSNNLHLLTEQEMHLYKFLKSLQSKNRLEQEKILQMYADERLRSIL